MTRREVIQHLAKVKKMASQLESQMIGLEDGRAGLIAEAIRDKRCSSKNAEKLMEMASKTHAILWALTELADNQAQIEEILADYRHTL